MPRKRLVTGTRKSKLGTAKNVLVKFALIGLIPVVIYLSGQKIWQLLQEPSQVSSIVEVLEQTDNATHAGYYDDALVEYNALHKDVKRISSKSKRAEMYSAIAIRQAHCYYSLGLLKKSQESIGRAIFYSELIFDLIPLNTGRIYWANAYYYLGLAHWALSEYEDEKRLQSLRKSKEFFEKCLDITTVNDNPLHELSRSALDILSQYLETLEKDSSSK